MRTVVPGQVLVQEVAEVLLSACKLARAGQHQAASTADGAIGGCTVTRHRSPFEQETGPGTAIP
ncbi:MAG: hypothetical protein OXI87_15040 [Albidovulum sp.]|nr:hypothetical protein [Albidovulum sp.]